MLSRYVRGIFFCVFVCVCVCVCVFWFSTKGTEAIKKGLNVARCRGSRQEQGCGWGTLKDTPCCVVLDRVSVTHKLPAGLGLHGSPNFDTCHLFLCTWGLQTPTVKLCLSQLVSYKSKETGL